LKRLDDDNADVRWRGASDLAQVLKRKESINLRTDCQFALGLAERLRTALEDLQREEKSIHEKIKDKKEEVQNRAWKKLDSQRNHVRFLAAALGDFPFAVGLPLLAELALNDKGLDFKGNTLLRRQAVWAIGNLGQNNKSFGQYPPDTQVAIVQALKKEAGKTGSRGEWAATALHYLGHPQSKPVEADQVLAQCAKAEDRYLRAQVALALNFWDGELTEPTLLLLSRDSGFGNMPRVFEND
jgi:HEAT repeat protein